MGLFLTFSRGAPAIAARARPISEQRFCCIEQINEALGIELQTPCSTAVAESLGLSNGTASIAARTLTDSRLLCWLRGLATTLTCSSMHLDWNYPYGGVGSQPPMPNATLRETPTATTLPLRRASCSDVNFRSCIAQWSMVLHHQDYHLRRCVTQTQPKTNARWASVVDPRPKTAA